MFKNEYFLVFEIHRNLKNTTLGHESRGPELKRAEINDFYGFIVKYLSYQTFM